MTLIECRARALLGFALCFILGILVGVVFVK